VGRRRARRGARRTRGTGEVGHHRLASRDVSEHVANSNAILVAPNATSWQRSHFALIHLVGTLLLVVIASLVHDQIPYERV
jgi:hypothetical protein